VPLPDDLTRPFWEAAKTGQLVLQRCKACGRWAHPPTPFCHACGSTDQRFEPISGRGRLVSATVVRSGARHPYFAGRVPYVVAVVELEEQEGLLMYTNLPGADPERVPKAGSAVVGEASSEGLPEFRVTSKPST
jgi:uncharacterized protein